MVAIGNPGGVRYSGSMTMGVVSAVNRSVANYSSTGITYIQTDTAINPGNSGGGLINMRGQIVGINTIKVVSSGYEIFYSNQSSKVHIGHINQRR